MTELVRKLCCLSYQQPDHEDEISLLRLWSVNGKHRGLALDLEFERFVGPPACGKRHPEWLSPQFVSRLDMDLQ